MKKLLFFSFGLLLFSQCVIDFPTYPIVSYDAPHYKGASDFVTQTYQGGEFVINLPNTANRVADSLHYVQQGLRLKEKCPCSDSLQLWGRVNLVPDNDVPPPPPRGNGDTGSIIRNYSVFSFSDTSFKFTSSNLPLNENIDRFRYPTNPRQTVVIGIDDTGINLSDQPTAASPFLFSNNGTPPFICGSDWLREGIYRMNFVNLSARRNSQESSEPLDMDGHGTFINGVLWGKAVLPNEASDANYFGSSESVALKFLHAKFVKDRQSPATLYDALCGVHYALSKGAKVINTSWRALATGDPDTLQRAFKPTMRAVKDHYHALLVASSGNDKMKLGQRYQHFGPISFPAAFSRDDEFGNNVIAVGAWNVSGAGSIPIFSNEDDYVDIYAPGVNITSTFITNTEFPYGKSVGSGTSYAAPYIARIAAILYGLHPEEESWANIKNLIIDRSDSRSPIVNPQQQIKLLNVPNIMANHTTLRSRPIQRQ